MRVRPGTAVLFALLLHAVTAGAQTIQAYAGSGGGGGFNGDDPLTTALTAQLNVPIGIAADASGNLYIADTANNRIRKVTPAGVITTFLGDGTTGPLQQPRGVAIHAASGDIYIADSGHNRILKVTGGVGAAAVFAGTGSVGNGANGIAATSSALNTPIGVAVDPAGNVYFSDSNNHRVRKVTAGTVNDIAGTAGSFGCNATRLFSPLGIALDAAGDLYIVDSNNNRVMRLSGGVMGIFAGQVNATTCLVGTADNQLANPRDVTVTQLGDVLIADGNNNKVKRVRAGVMTAIAGTGAAGTSGDNGPATSALLSTPQGIVPGLPNSHVYYVADTVSNRVRKVVPPAPSAPTVNSITPGATSLSVAFTPVSTLDVPATSFTATCVPGTFQAAGNSSPIVVTGLTPSVQYGCTVTANNGGGTSASSNSVNAIPGTAPAFTSAAPAGGSFNVAYTHTYTATGAPTPTFSLTSGALPAGLTLAAGGALTGTPTAAGAFTGTVTAANTVLPNATQPFSITIAKAAQAISFAALPDRIIGSGPFTLSATGGASGNAVAFTSQTPSTCTATGTNGTTLTLVAAGTCTIAADQAGAANYAAAPTVTRGFTVQPKVAQAIVFAALVDRLVGSGPFTLSATGGASGNALTFASTTTSICTTTGTNGTTLTLLAVGTCTITADQAGTAGYDPAPQVTRSFGVQQPGHLVNISTRMQVLTGNDVMIGGFVIGGSGSKRVAVVATGPSLAAYGITNALANPTLTLVRQSGQQVIATNDDWQSAANAADLQAAGFAPAHALESAILTDLVPGAYTAIVSGSGSSTGVGIVAVYEVDNAEIPLANISTRGQVLTGSDVMIGGFVISGASPQTVAIVATGPSLAAFGIANPLANPTVTLVRSSDQVVIATNDDWQGDPNAAQLQAAGFAPSNPLESGLYVTLPPGAYTAIVQGVNSGTGVAVIGVYKVN